MRRHSVNFRPVLLQLDIWPAFQALIHSIRTRQILNKGKKKQTPPPPDSFRLPCVCVHEVNRFPYDKSAPTKALGPTHNFLTPWNQWLFQDVNRKSSSLHRTWRPDPQNIFKWYNGWVKWKPFLGFVFILQCLLQKGVRKVLQGVPALNKSFGSTRTHTLCTLKLNNGPFINTSHRLAVRFRPCSFSTHQTVAQRTELFGQRTTGELETARQVGKMNTQQVVRMIMGQTEVLTSSVSSHSHIKWS